MKIFLLALSAIFLTLSASSQSPYDFDNELSNIARSFRNDIMDEDQCKRLKREAEDLAEEIEDVLDEEDDFFLWYYTPLGHNK